jgi:hypothetical protein
MTRQPKLFPIRSDWRVFAIMDGTMPLRDHPDEEDDEEQDDEENRTVEPPVVREPDEG